MKLLWSPLAIQRAEEIAEYIAQHDPDAAARWLDGLFAAVERLEAFPRMGPVVPEFREESLRQVVHRKHRIVYRVTESEVRILTIRHGRQLLDEGELDD